MKKHGMHRGYSYVICLKRNAGTITSKFYDPYTNERIEEEEPFHLAVGYINGKEVYCQRFLLWNLLAPSSAVTAENFVRKRIETEYPTKRPPAHITLSILGFK